MAFTEMGGISSELRSTTSGPSWRSSPDRPVSFEVFADDFASMAEQARTISAWGPNVNVKIPITNTKGQSSGELLRVLSSERRVLNVTAIFTLDQIRIVADALDPATPAIVSVFAGRIADTGVDPIPHMLACKQILSSRPKAQLLWASTREVLNIFHAEQYGCDIITVPNEFLSKLGLIDKDLIEYSRETVQAFHRDATRGRLSDQARALCGRVKEPNICGPAA